MPRIGIGPAALSGTLNFTDVSFFFKPNHPLSDFGFASSLQRVLPCSRDTSPATSEAFNSLRRRLPSRLDRGASQSRQCAGQFFVRIIHLGALEQTLDDAASKPRILRAHRDARGAPDCRARLACYHDRFPGGRRRPLRFRGDNLDFVTVDEFGRERCDLSVDLAAYGGIADVGMPPRKQNRSASPCAAMQSACPWV